MMDKQTLIYDDDCPMCAVYTAAFIKSGMLDSQGRMRYSEVVRANKYPIDQDRARNEIALVNRENGEVVYGLDSLMHILRGRWPWLHRLFAWPPFYRLMDVFYKFISYNRKVIAPAPVYQKPDACTPDYHHGYRIAYLLFTWIITSTILGSYVVYFNSLLELSNSVGREFLVCGGQLIWQGTLVYMLHRDRCMEYLGNMMTISLAGAILLLPGQWVFMWLGGLPELFVGWFLVVAGLMFLEHIRRVRLIGVTGWLTLTWVLYRMVVLLILLTL